MLVVLLETWQRIDDDDCCSGAVLPNGSTLYDHGRIYDHLAKMVVFWSPFQPKSRFSPKVGHIWLAFSFLAL